MWYVGWQAEQVNYHRGKELDSSTGNIGTMVDHPDVCDLFDTELDIPNAWMAQVHTELMLQRRAVWKGGNWALLTWREESP